ncbi:SDR family NAD(P)-dependent oxidoreductase [Nocardioides convexus]|uniref:SDR family NAD(P)-dependent oxidoreductase n=1 Tax=Nocardioides convexus TaxID=2712224 RepID=UPI00241863D3|nr:SDR family NAD(P)-dependent oxidoreductase [Nocardioides convexus]
MPGLATYCGTKFAVIGFTEAARLEYRKSGVRLSTVRPTFTNTEPGVRDEWGQGHAQCRAAGDRARDGGAD